jgi:ABC-type transport system involved in cytochrome c biogenesis permease subunit
MSARSSGLRGGAWLPIVLFIIALLYVASSFRPARDDASGYHLNAFGRLPVVHDGRIKPMDTLARTSLMVLSNKQTMWLNGEHGTSDIDQKKDHEKVPAIRWMLDVIAQPRKARSYEVFRIDHPDVLSLIGATTDRKYFSIDELMARQAELNRQFEMTRQVDRNEWTPYQRQLMTLHEKIGLYFAIEDVATLLAVPPAPGGTEWTSIEKAGADPATTPKQSEYATALTATFLAWHEDNAPKFNAGVETVAASFEMPGNQKTRVHYEAYFNHMAPFIVSMGLYVLVFVLAALSWLRMSGPLARSALWILILALVVHTIGLISRIYIQGRPPVTNLYSSAIFVGWGGAVLGMVLERLYRNGIGAVTAAGLGFLTLLVAHNLSMDGDTMTMMQAVLDTNFWLATHVVVITLGYGATFLAGFLAIVFIMRGVFTRGLDTAMATSLSRMIYGIIAFATLFSFVGTILGGIWADQSWGRFWGWDPKENGALLIVLWNALVLHARWGGLVRQRGIAVMGVAGNIVTSWSWFGTNMLGVGLHAYGFIDSALFWMLVFVGSQLAIIGIGLIPLKYWRSPAMRAMDKEPKPKPTLAEGPAAPARDSPV